MWVVGPRLHIPRTSRMFSVLGFGEGYGEAWKAGCRLCISHHSSCFICKCGALLPLWVPSCECSLADKKCSMWTPLHFLSLPPCLSFPSQSLPLFSLPKFLFAFYFWAMGLPITFSCLENLSDFSMGYDSQLFFFYPILQGKDLPDLRSEESTWVIFTSGRRMLSFFWFFFQISTKNVRCPTWIIFGTYYIFLKCVYLLPEFSLHHLAFFFFTDIALEEARPILTLTLLNSCFVSFAAEGRDNSNSALFHFTLCVWYLLLSSALW